MRIIRNYGFWPDDVARLEKLAKSLRRSMSQTVRLAIEDFIGGEIKEVERKEGRIKKNFNFYEADGKRVESHANRLKCSHSAVVREAIKEMQWKLEK